MEWLVLVVLVGLFFVFARFTIVEEGTAKAVKRFGEFLHIIFRWQGHWMDEQCTVLRDEEVGEFLPAEKLMWSPPWRIFGGLYLYGFWPIHTVHDYKHRWTDIRIEKDGKVVLEFHEERLYHVLLRPAVYGIRLVDVETSPTAEERVPVTVLILATIRIVNPYRFLFVAPPTPIEDVLARMGAELRAILSGRRLDDLLVMRGGSLWAEGAEVSLLGGAKFFETLEKWGMRLADRGIEVRDLDLPLEYQKALAARREQQLLAAARAEKIRGTVISAIARSDGRPETQIQEEFRADPAAFYQRHQRTIDDTMTRLSMEERAYLKIETPGADGLLQAFLSLIGAWQRMPPGGGESRASEPRARPEDTRPDPVMEAARRRTEEAIRKRSERERR